MTEVKNLWKNLKRLSRMDGQREGKGRCGWFVIGRMDGWMAGWMAGSMGGLKINWTDENEQKVTEINRVIVGEQSID